ncbi:hypothetical protein NW768_011541 [Fusarium equiseti]|uniref:Uncharacterized protein n=1 Tax=Fusarium equiseti TaxID=61235 RepID=A0ABQ8QXU1_FUSEQ|nr:hypothetical protein NW768_011541 [Fusarium equiseti]
MHRLQAKKKSQAKRKSQSKEVPVKEEDPAKGQNQAKEKTPATKSQWTKYPIETELIAQMKPLSSPVTRDLEHEVICDFNIDDALPAERYKPEIACSQGTSILLMQNSVNPDFRFDNIDIIAHAGTLGACSMFFDHNTPANAEQLGLMRFQLWGNALFIYNHEETRGGSLDGFLNAILFETTSKEWRRPYRAVKYNFGGLKCMVLFAYEILCPDPSAATTTDEGNSALKNARKGKAKSKPDNNTENSVAEYTGSVMMHKYGDEDEKIRALAQELPFD